MPTLLELPAEIFERIAEVSPPYNLLIIRLLCKDAASKVLRTYIKTFFTVLRLRLTENQLRRAMDIMEHPVFGQQIDKVMIDIDEIDEEGRYYGMQVADGNRGYRRPNPGRELLAARTEQRNMREKQIALHMLTVLFCKIRKHRSAIEFMLSDKGVDPYTRPRMYDLLRSDVLPPRFEDCSALLTVLEALNLSGLCTTLFFAPAPNWALPVHRFIESPTGLVSFHGALSAVKALSLSLWNGIGYDEECTNLFADALGALPQLQKLLIHIRETCPDQEFTWHEMCAEGHLASAIFQARAPAFSSLTDLALTGCVYDDDSRHTKIEFGELITFLDSMSTEGSLQNLTLSHVSMVGRSSYREPMPDYAVAEMLKKLTGVETYCFNCVEEKTDD